MGIALFVTGNLAAILTAVGLVDLLNVRGDRWLRVTAGVVCCGAAIVVTLLITGLTGMLRPWAPVVLLSVVAAVLTVLAAGARSRRGDSPPAAQDELPMGPLMRVFVALTVAMGAATAARLCFGPTGFAFDDLTYHAPAVAEWIQQGRLTLGAFTYQAYYVHNAALISLWFALPGRGDALVSLGSVYWLLLLVVAATTLARQIGARGWLQAVPALGLLLSSQVMLQVARFTPTGLAEAGAVAAALALIVPALQRKPSDGLGAIICAGLAAGLAIGTRSSALPLVALLVIVVLIRLVRECRPRAGLQVAVSLLIAIVITGGYWYARNLALTGNPLYPAAVASFDGPFDAQARAETTLLHRLREADPGATGVAFTLWRLLDWPRSLGLFALLGYGIGLAAALRGSVDARQRTVIAVLGVGIAAAALCPLMPFSGTINIPGDAIRPGLRYWMLPFSLGLVLTGAARQEWARWLAPVSGTMLALTIYADLTGHAPADFRTFMFAALALGAVGALWWQVVRRRIWIPATRARTIIALAVALLISLGAWAPTKQRLTDAELFSREGVGEGWRAVNDLPDGSRIAWFGPLAYAYYPLYGRDYQFDPVPVFDDGRPWTPLHERSEAPVSWWDVVHHQQHRWGDPGDLSSLVTNLHAQRIDYVFTTEHGADQWPSRGQAQVLAESEHASPIYADGTNTIWRLRDTAPGRPSGEEEDP